MYSFRQWEKGAQTPALFSMTEIGALTISVTPQAFRLTCKVTRKSIKLWFNGVFLASKIQTTTI